MNQILYRKQFSLLVKIDLMADDMYLFTVS